MSLLIMLTYFLTHCFKHVTLWVQLYPTLCNPMDLPGTSVHGILQARILKWGAIPFHRALEENLSRLIIFVFDFSWPSPALLWPRRCWGIQSPLPSWTGSSTACVSERGGAAPFLPSSPPTHCCLHWQSWACRLSAFGRCLQLSPALVGTFGSSERQPPLSEPLQALHHRG